MNGYFFRAKKSMNNSLCTAIEVGELIMQEEANQRTVGLVVTATKFTGRIFARAVDRYLQHRRTVIREHNSFCFEENIVDLTVVGL